MNATDFFIGLVMFVGFGAAYVRFYWQGQQIKRLEASNTSIVRVLANGSGDEGLKLLADKTTEPNGSEKLRLAEIELEREKVAATLEAEKARLQASVDKSFWGSR